MIEVRKTPISLVRLVRQSSYIYWISLFIFLVFSTPNLFAGSNQSLIYQGRIVRPDGNVPNSGTITFTLSLYSPAPSKCLLYSETQSINMTGSGGLFSLALGSGTRTDGGAHAFSKIFINGGTLSGLSCASGSAYSPASTDDRSLAVSFNDNGTVVQLSSMEVKSVPFALQAAEIGGYGVNDIVKIHPTTGSATTFTAAEMAVAKVITSLACANNEIIKYNGTTWACSADATGGAPSDASYAAKGIVQFDTNAATSGITVAAGVAKLSNTGVAANTYGSATKVGTFTVDAQGRITSASDTNIAIPPSQITQGGAANGEVLKWNGTNWVPSSDLGTTTDASYAAKGIVQFNTDAATSGISVAAGVATVNTGTGANQIVKLDGTGKLPAIDGSALTGVTATGYSGVLPIANGGTNSSTALNNNRIMISSGGKIVEAPAMTDGQIMIGSTGAAPTAATLGQSNGISITNGAGTISIATNATSANTASTIVSRDASGNFNAGTGSFSSTQLRGSTSGTLTITVPTTVTDYTIKWPATVGGAGTFLTTDASGNLSWGSPAAISDASYAVKGAVQFDTNAATSGITVASGVASVNTGTGANQIVKLDGSAKLPAVDGSALTGLTAAQIPDLDAGKITSGVLPIARGGTNNGSLGVTAGGVVYGDGSKLMMSAAGTSGQALLSTGAGAPAFGTLGVAAGGTGLTSFSPNALVMANGTGAGLISMTCSLNEILKWNGTAWACGADNTPGDASYAAKGIVQFDTNAATSGITIASGVASVNSGTGANQIVKLDGTSKLPAVDGSALTNLSAGNISSGTLPIARGGTNSGAALSNNKVMVSSGGAIVEGNGFGSASAANTFITRDASENFAANEATLNSMKLKGATSGTLTISVPTTVTDYTIKWPNAVGAAGSFLTTDASGNLSWGSPAAISDASYAVKGAVQFDTNAATSGISVASGVASVNTGTGANQIVKLDGSSKLPAVDGSALTNLSAGNISSGTLPIARGGTGQTSATAAFDALSPLTTKGDVVVHNGTNNIRLPVGTNNYVLTADSAQASGLKWAAVPTPGDASFAAKGIVQGDTDAATSGLTFTAGVIKVNSGTGANQIVKLDGTGKLPAIDGSALTNITATGYSGVLPIANGGTNSSTALNNDRMMISSGGKIVEAPAMTNGQIMIGSTGAAPTAATLGQSNGISITNGAGTISIATNATSANTVSTIVSRDASGNFAAGTATFNSTKLNGSTSGTLTFTVPTTVTDYTIRWPGAVGAAGTFLTTDAFGNLSWGSPAAISDASYAVKGAVQFDTNAATSGIIVASGVASVNTGTGANQIVKLDGSGKLPAIDASAVTGLTATQIPDLDAAKITSGVLPIARGGTNNGSLGVTAGGVAYGDGSKLMMSAAGTSGQALISAGAGAPAFGTLGVAGGGTGLTSFTTGDIPYASGATTISKLGIGANGTILTSNGTAPAWSSVSSLGFFVNGGNTVAGTAVLGTDSAHNLEIETNGSTKMTVESGGDVGIGITNPAYRLDVVRTGLTASTYYDISRFAESSTGRGIGIGYTANSGGTGVESAHLSSIGNTVNLVIGTASQSDAIRVLDANGFVGIGSITPDSRLDINGAITQRGMAAPAASPAGQGRIYFDSTANKFKVSQNGAAYVDLVPGATADASYATKGVVQFNTDAATSGISVAAGVATVNTGTGANQIVKLDGSSRLPAVDGSNLTNLDAGDISAGVLPIARGGTNNGSLGVTAGGVVYGDGSKLMMSAAGTSGQALISAAAGAPAFGTLGVGGGGTGLTSGTSGGIPYFSAASTMASSAALTANGVVLGGGAGAAPTSTAAGAAYSVLRVPSGGGAPVFGAIDLSQSAAVTGTLAIGNGGTGVTSLTPDRLLGTTVGGALSFVTCAQGQVLSFNATGVYGCYNVGSIFNGFVNGGNTFTATATLGTDSAHNLEIETGGTTKMTIESGGDVGIGTTNPTAALEISRTAAATGFTNSPLKLVDSGNMYVGPNSVDGRFNVMGSASNVANWDLYLGMNGGAPANGKVHIVTGVSGSATPRLTVQQDGKVGIGTTAPDDMLDVRYMSGAWNLVSYMGGQEMALLSAYNTDESGERRLAFYKYRGTWGTPLVVQNGDALSSIYSNGYDGSNSIISTGIESYVDGVPSAGHVPGRFEFHTDNGTTNEARMVIKADGKVGIGTTSPSGIFHVRGSTASYIDRAGSPSHLMLRRGNGSVGSETATVSGDTLGRISMVGHSGAGYVVTSQTGIRSDATENWNATNNGSALVFATTPNTTITAQDRMKIDQNGNVGIGEMSPRSALDVKGAISGNPAVSVAAGTVDFASHNLAYTAQNCGAFALWNMKDGSSYTFAVQGTTSALCSFTAFSGSGSGALTVKMPPDHTLTTTGKDTVYTFLVLGSTVYVSWIPGY